MDIASAILQRKSIREFLDKIVDIEIVKNVNFYGCNHKGYANSNTFKCCGDKVILKNIIS